MIYINKPMREMCILCILACVCTLRAAGQTVSSCSPSLSLDFLITERIENKENTMDGVTTYNPEVIGAEVVPILINRGVNPVSVVTRGLKVCRFARNVSYEYVVRSYRGTPMRESITNLGIVTLAPAEAVALEPFAATLDELRLGIVFSYTVGDFVADWTKCWHGALSTTALMDVNHKKKAQ